MHNSRSRTSILSDPVGRSHLLDDRIRERVPFELCVKNILNDARDFANYRYAIPVIFVNEQEIARYRLTDEQLLAALGG